MARSGGVARVAVICEAPGSSPKRCRGSRHGVVDEFASLSGCLVGVVAASSRHRVHWLQERRARGGSARHSAYGRSRRGAPEPACAVATPIGAPSSVAIERPPKSPRDAVRRGSAGVPLPRPLAPAHAARIAAPDPDIESSWFLLCGAGGQRCAGTGVGACAGEAVALARPSRRRSAWQVIDGAPDLGGNSLLPVARDRCGRGEPGRRPDFCSLFKQVAWRRLSRYVPPRPVTRRARRRARSLSRLDVQIGLKILKASSADRRNAAGGGGGAAIPSESRRSLRIPPGRDRPVLCSLQNYSRAFTLESLRVLTTPCVVLLIDVPRVADPVKADQMRLVSKRLAKSLEGCSSTTTAGPSTMRPLPIRSQVADDRGGLAQRTSSGRYTRVASFRLARMANAATAAFRASGRAGRSCAPRSRKTTATTARRAEYRRREYDALFRGCRRSSARIPRGDRHSPTQRSAERRRQSSRRCLRLRCSRSTTRLRRRGGRIRPSFSARRWASTASRTRSSRIRWARVARYEAACSRSAQRAATATSRERHRNLRNDPGTAAQARPPRRSRSGISRLRVGADAQARLRALNAAQAAQARGRSSIAQCGGWRLRQLDPKMTAGRKLTLCHGSQSIGRAQAPAAGRSAILDFLESLHLPSRASAASSTGSTASEVLPEHRRQADKLRSRSMGSLQVDALAQQAALGFVSVPRALRSPTVPREEMATRSSASTSRSGRTGALTPVARSSPFSSGRYRHPTPRMHNEDEVRRKDVRVRRHRDRRRAGDVIPESCACWGKAAQSDARIRHARKCPECGSRRAASR